MLYIIIGMLIDDAIIRRGFMSISEMKTIKSLNHVVPVDNCQFLLMICHHGDFILFWLEKSRCSLFFDYLALEIPDFVYD